LHASVGPERTGQDILADCEPVPQSEDDFVNGRNEELSIRLDSFAAKSLPGRLQFDRFVFGNVQIKNCREQSDSAD
jgi:hypothetical protein